MASSEQISLSDYIKSIHEKLRQESKRVGAEKAWSKHCSDEEMLSEYSKSMKALACNFWENNSKVDSKAVSRVLWSHEACLDYFTNISKHRQKDEEIMKKIGIQIEENKILEECKLYDLLDVGSCYNPFAKFENYKVLAIDIAPACDSVFQCDFLNVLINDKLIFEGNIIKELPENNFFVIIFSLLLEYLPTPELRYICCKNAYKLLKTEGILIIITPDSKHVGANAQIIKSWKFILADMGFSRTKYEKLPYLHCMVFRKSLNMEVTKRWSNLHRKMQVYDKIYIPQDFKNKGCE